MTQQPPHAPRPDHPPPAHRVVEHRTKHGDPFTPSHPPEPPSIAREDTAGARGGLSAALLGGLVFLVLCLGFALIFTDLFR